MQRGRSAIAIIRQSIFAGGLAAIVALAAVAVPPAAASAAPVAPSAPAALAADEPRRSDSDQRIAAADVFGLGADAQLLGRTGDCNFVIGIWEHLRDNRPASREARTAAEWAFAESEDACYEFIVTEIFAAKRRDDANAIAEAEEKRRSDAARSAAAAAIDVVADAELLSGSDGDFARRIWDRVVEDPKWPKVKAAARAARDGSAELQRQFVDAGLAAAAKQDVDDAIAADVQRTEQERERLRSRAAKQSAAYRVGLVVTEQLLSLPDRDFVTEVWNGTPDGSEVQAAAVRAARSNDPAVWRAFIDTGVHQAKDRDIQLALERAAAEDRRLANEVLARARRAHVENLVTAAVQALAGSPDAVADFLRVGQHQVATDASNRPGPGVWEWVNPHSGKCLGVNAGAMVNGAKITLWTCGAADQQWLATRVWNTGGRYRLVNGKDRTKCLSLPTGDPTNQLVIRTCDGAADQYWYYGLTGNAFTWINEKTHQAVTVQDSGKQDGARIIAWDRVGANGQSWVGTSSSLSTEQRLNRGQYLHSVRNRFRLIVQHDGNLVLYQGTTALWASNTRDGAYLVNQLDGNLVLYRSNNTAAWSSKTHGSGRSTLIVQEDGNAVMYRASDGKARWATGTCCR